jgi:protein-tyrosine phosphatase
MRGFVDLHCHWVANVDDGARSPEDGVAMLRGLYEAGFTKVVATPHMRPGMFDNDRSALLRAYSLMLPHLQDASERGVRLPEVHLSSEHFFDDVVWARLLRGEGVPYPALGDGSTEGAPSPPGLPRLRVALVEFSPQAFPLKVAERLVDLKRAGLRVVLAHPERYRPVWTDDACLDPLIDAGARLLLDIRALVGRYGRSAQSAAEKLLEEDAYDAACSDAHRVEDVAEVERAILRLETRVGPKETLRLLSEGPSAILAGG